MPTPIMRTQDLYTNAAMQGAVAPIASVGTASLWVEGRPVIQITDQLLPVPDQALPTGKTVYHNGLPLVGQLDPTLNSGQMILGALTTFIS